MNQTKNKSYTTQAKQLTFSIMTFTKIPQFFAKYPSVEDTAPLNMPLHLCKYFFKHFFIFSKICTMTKKKTTNLYFRNKNGTKKYFLSHTKQKGFFAPFNQMQVLFVDISFYPPTLFLLFCRKFCKANSKICKKKQKFQNRFATYFFFSTCLNKKRFPIF